MIRDALAGVTRIFIGLGSLLTVLGFLGGLFWVFDLAANFRLHLATVGMAFTLFAGLQRLKITATIAGLATLTNAVLVAPLYMGMMQNDAPSTTGKPLRIVMANVQQNMGDPKVVGQFLDDLDADVVGLVEVNKKWMRALKPHLKRWRYRLIKTRDDNFGMALLAKTRLKGEAKSLAGGLPTIVARIKHDGGEIGLVLVHPPPPVSGEIAGVRNKLFESLSGWRSQWSDDLVIFGDFNATPWSVPFRDLLSSAGLRHGRLGQGYQPSWPTRLFKVNVGMFGLPIDHVLIGGDLQFIEHQIGPKIGSDHRPLLVTIKRMNH